MNSINRKVIALASLSLLAVSVSQAAINVTIAGTSTSTQLDLVASGTVEATDFGADSNTYDRFYMWAPGLDWISTSSTLANSATNVVDGPANTAPSIAGGVSYILNGSPTVLVSGTHDSIYLRELDPDIAVGDVIDWSFSVRNFGISAYDFTPLINAGPSLSGQVGSGTAVPEASTFLLLVACLAGFVIRRRR